MSRSERLLELLQLLRQHRQPVSGGNLAQQLRVSVRTVYRDIVSLRAQGAAIEGEPSLGYVLKPGFTLPPLMFSEEEVEAIVLGSRWVTARTDDRLAEAASRALAKIAAVLSDDMRQNLEGANLLIGPRRSLAPECVDVAALREAIRSERKIEIRYQDGVEAVTERIVWPFALGFFDRACVLVAWCELRRDYRAFRTDRIEALSVAQVRYPKHRAALLKEWKQREGIPYEL